MSWSNHRRPSATSFYPSPNSTSHSELDGSREQSLNMASRSSSLSVPAGRGSVTPSPLIAEKGRAVDVEMGGEDGRRASTTADTGREQVEARARAKEAEAEQDPEGDQDGGQTVKLTDFDVVETLGTGTFGRVLLVRLRPAANQPGAVQHFAMKVLRKSEVVRLKQVEHVNSERNILSRIRHPFIVDLYATFQDHLNVYMLLSYVPGGELFSHLRRAGRFSPDVTRFYLSTIVLALRHLHAYDIIYRDLKPENLLLDHRGYLRIADFGFAKIAPLIPQVSSAGDTRNFSNLPLPHPGDIPGLIPSAMPPPQERLDPYAYSFTEF
ncbi:serine/threonine protein kinase, AGC [Ceratobasidium sp. 394]|nr:serine/threonine protein kinase, AGC [Ceratobasidium sp. 394]